MNPLEELRDLKENPLPATIILNPLTRILEIDGEVGLLMEQARELEREKKELMDYAIENNIEEDEKGCIKKDTRKARTFDILRFRTLFPEEYDAACAFLKRDLEREIKKIGTKFNITLIDKLIKPIELEAAGVVTVTESYSYRVIRKI